MVSGPLRIAIDMRAVVSRLRDMQADLLPSVGTILYQFVEEQVATPAKRQYVPVMTGALRSSIVTEQPIISGNTVSVSIGAGGAAAPYALAVHENPRSGQTQGLSPTGKRYKNWARVGEWKYLETPAIEAARRSDVIMTIAEREIRRISAR